MGLQEPHEIQPEQDGKCYAGIEQHLAEAQAVDCQTEEQLLWKVPEGQGVQQAKHDPALCSGQCKGQPRPEPYEQECHQSVNGWESCSL